jgi:hypothetical protein
MAQLLFASASAWFPLAMKYRMAENQEDRWFGYGGHVSKIVLAFGMAWRQMFSNPSAAELEGHDMAQWKVVRCLTQDMRRRI